MRFLKPLCKCLNTSLNTLCAQIVDHKNLRFCAGIRYSLSRIILAVCARECRNQDLRLCYLNSRRTPGFALKGEILHRCLAVRNVATIYALQLALVNIQHFRHLQGLLAAADDCIISDYTNVLRVCNIFGNLQQNAAIGVIENRFRVQNTVIAETKIITKCHLHDCLTDTAQAGSIGRYRLASSQELSSTIPDRNQGFRFRQTILDISRTQAHQTVTSLLKLRRNNILRFSGSNSKRYQCGRHIQIFKCTTHRVLAANGANSQFKLCFKRTQQSCQGLAPTACILTQTLKILLESKVNIFKRCTSCNQLGNRFHDCQICTMIGALLHDEGVVAPRHKGAIICMLLLNRDLLHHSLNGR